MELLDLGFNEWFIQKLNESGKTDYQLARVTLVNRGSYYIRSNGGEVLAELSGEFVFSAESSLQYPVVGDWVFVKYFDDNYFAIIYDVLPRKTFLRRKTAGKEVDYQMMVTGYWLIWES